MLSFLIASSGPETAMNDMQRSLPVEPDSRALRRRSRGRAACTLRHAAEIEWRENFPCCKPLKSHEMGKSTGYAATLRRCRSKSRRAARTLPRKSPAGCGAGSLAVAASSTAPVRRKHDPVVALDRGRDQAFAHSAAASAGSRSAGSPMPPSGQVSRTLVVVASRPKANRSGRRNVPQRVSARKITQPLKIVSVASGYLAMTVTVIAR